MCSFCVVVLFCFCFEGGGVVVVDYVLFVCLFLFLSWVCYMCVCLWFLVLVLFCFGFFGGRMFFSLLFVRVSACVRVSKLKKMCQS